MNHKEQLKTVLQSVINGKEEEAAAQMHDFFVSKTRQVAGLQTSTVSEIDDLDLEHDLSEGQNHFDDAAENMPKFEKAHVPGILKELGVSSKTELKFLIQSDSSQRLKLRQIIERITDEDGDMLSPALHFYSTLKNAGRVV